MEGEKDLMRVGFEPTPFRTGALNRRLRPLGHLTTEHTQRNIASSNIHMTRQYTAQLLQPLPTPNHG